MIELLATILGAGLFGYGMARLNKRVVNIFEQRRERQWIKDIDQNFQRQQRIEKIRNLAELKIRMGEEPIYLSHSDWTDVSHLVNYNEQTIFGCKISSLNQRERPEPSVGYTKR